MRFLANELALALGDCVGLLLGLLLNRREFVLISL